MKTRPGSRLAQSATWIADRELWFIICCSPALLAPGSIPLLTVTAAAVIPLLWLARWRARGRLTTRTRLDLPILGIMLMTPVGVLASMDPAQSLSKAAGLLLGIALYYGVLNQGKSLRLLGAVPAAAWLVLILGLVGIDWLALKIPLLTPIYTRLPRLISGVPRTMKGGFHPNEVGGTLAMLIPLVIAWWQGRPATFLTPADRSGPAHWLHRILHSKAFVALTIVVSLLGLLLTQSRTSMAAVAAALLLIGALQSQWLLWLMVLGSGVIAMVIWRLGTASIVQRLSALPGTYTWAGRPEIWANALRTIADFPLTGIGLNVFAPASRVRYAYLVARPSWDFVHAHNIFVQTGVDLGVIGLVCFVAMAIVLGIMVARAVRNAENTASKRLAAALAASVASYLVFGAIDAITLGAKPSLIFWLAAGLIAQASARRAAPEHESWADRLENGLALGVPLILCSSLLVCAPIRSIALSNLGQLQMARGAPAASIPLLERALEQNRGNRHAGLALAQARAYLGQDDAALSIWRESGYPPIRVSDKGEALRLEGRAAEAARWQNLALALDARLSDAWYRLALAYEDQGRDGEAVAALERALDADRFVSMGSSEVIRHYLRVLLDSRPTETGPEQPGGDAVDDANRLVDQGKVAEALEALASILQEEPDNPRAWVIMGKARSRQQDWDQAILAFEKSLSIEPQGFWANHLLASLYATRKEWSKVAGLALAAAEIAPSGELRAADIILLLEAYEEMGDLTAACSLLEQIESWADAKDLAARLGATWHCAP